MTPRKVSVHTHRPGLALATGAGSGFTRDPAAPSLLGPAALGGSADRRQVRVCRLPRGQLPTSTGRCPRRGAPGGAYRQGCGARRHWQGRAQGGRLLRAPGQGLGHPSDPVGKEAGHSPSSRRRPCACRSRPGSRRGRAWGTRSRRRPPAARSGGRPGSRGAERLRQGRRQGGCALPGPRPPLSRGLWLVCAPGVIGLRSPRLGVRPWLGHSLGGFGRVSNL